MSYIALAVASVFVVIKLVVAFRRRREKPPNYGPEALKDKVVVITGASDGIGVPTATAIAAMGAHTILAVRNEAKGKKVAQDIIRKTGNKKVEVMHLDLSSFKDVRAFVEQYKAKKLPLNILINNAGVNIFGKYYTTVDGFELQYQINHLSPFLLTNLLLDTISASQPARIINVASHSHYRATSIDWDNLNGEKYLPSNKLHFYNQSKLFNVLFTNELTRRLNQTGKTISVNALHPGSLVPTNLFTPGYPTWIKIIIKLLSLLGLTKTLEEGAWTTIIAAADPKYINNGGLYLSGATWIPASKLAKDEETARKLWDVSAKLTSLKK